MAKKEDIITLPNKHLRKTSQRVGLITEDVIKVVEEMKEATRDWDASRKHELTAALAAVQIDILQRIVIVRENDKPDSGYFTLINPEITKYEGEIVRDSEGCLSIKHIYGNVPRHSKVRIKAKNINGKEFRMTLDGFLARILQHEIDHTKGILFVDRIKDDREAFFRLEDDGKLTKLDYDKEIKDNRTLWQ